MDQRPLEPTGADLRDLLATVGAYVSDYVDGLPGAPASDFGGIPALLADPDIRRPPPARGRPLADLLGTVDRAAGKGLNPSHGGYLAFIPGSGLVSAAVADLVADVLNRYTGMAFPAPGMVALEAGVLRWMCDLFDLPPSAQGMLTTGGSLATLSAVLTVRETHLPDDFRTGTFYVTDQTHACVAKAVRLAGFPAGAVRAVPTDRDHRMSPAALRAAIAADRAAGRQPACVVASAGSTNTGTVDALPALADVAAQEGLWLHVDAAYGGFFQLTARGRARLAGIERADSIVLDAHKGLFLPFGTGCLLVRDADLLRRAHSTGGTAHYLQDIEGGDLPDFAAYAPELTRDFRGLRVWLPLHLHGVDAFRAALDEKLDLAEYAYQALAADPNLTVPAEPELSTVVLHLATDDATRELLARVNAEGRVYMTSTMLDGRYTVRLSILNHRTDRAIVDEALDAIHRHASTIVKSLDLITDV